jgi:hypothetical protein
VTRFSPVNIIAVGNDTRDNQTMPWIIAIVVLCAVIFFVLVRVGRSKGLDSLGAVSQRWIADERAASRNDHS